MCPSWLPCRLSVQHTNENIERHPSPPLPSPPCRPQYYFSQASVVIRLMQLTAVSQLLAAPRRLACRAHARRQAALPFRALRVRRDVRLPACSCTHPFPSMQDNWSVHRLPRFPSRPVQGDRDVAACCFC